MSQLIISTNIINGIMDEAGFAPEQFAHTDVGEENKCFQIALFDLEELIPMAAAFVFAVNNSELLHELLHGYTICTEEKHPTVHWSGIAAPDWDWDAKDHDTTPVEGSITYFLGNDYLSVLVREAFLLPTDLTTYRLDNGNDCFAVTLPHYQHLVTLTKAIWLCLPDEIRDVMCTYFCIADVPQTPEIVVYWPSVTALDLEHFQNDFRRML